MRAVAMLAVLVAGYSASSLGGSAAFAETITERVPQGEKVRIWTELCDGIFCRTNVCLTFTDRNGNPARAKIYSKARFRDEVVAEATGRYCVPSRNLGPFMDYKVAVEALDDEMFVSYIEPDRTD